MRFQRRICILPGFYLNLGKGGVSISVGPRGCKMTIGKHGIKGAVGIPGTGIRFETPYCKMHGATFSSTESKPPHSSNSGPTGLKTNVDRLRDLLSRQ